eukprot:1299118-Amphidinium_carterae.1
MFTPLDDDEYLAIVYHFVHMVNQLANRSGYSAIQRVLGYMPQLPNELLHESNHPALIKEGPMEAVKRSEQIRAVALEAWARVSSRQKTLAALRSRSRGPQRPFTPGERVWVWRSPGSGRSEAWYGPGTIVSLTPTGAYVSLRGSLWKSLRTDMSREGLRTQRRYVDCTRERDPPLQITDDVVDQERSEPANRVEPLPIVAETAEQSAEAVELQVEQQVEDLAGAPMEEEGHALPPGQVRPAGAEHEEAPPGSRARQQEADETAPLFRGARVLQAPPSTEPPQQRWTLMDEDGSSGQVQKGVVLPEELPPHLLELFLRSRAKEEKAFKKELCSI